MAIRISRAQGSRSVFRPPRRILEIDPPRLLAYTWFANWHENPAHRTVVRWELSPTKTGTRVKLTHSGLAHLPGGCEGYSQGWPGLLQQIKKFAEK
ncbi:MAG: SRPBCC domain-containing protein [Candidatus Sulfotelmatobacter sp.]